MPRNPSPTPTTSSRSNKLRVVIAGGGVAALETALALADLAPDHTDVTVIAPNGEFVYRPMVVREPFAYGAAHRYPLESVLIFQIPTTLITGSHTTVSLINGAQACNVFWQVGSSATLGTGTHFVGTIMAAESITANTDATIHGRLLAQTAAVTLEANTITTSNCASSVSGSGGGTETTTPEEAKALEVAAAGGEATTTGTTVTTTSGTTTGTGAVAGIGVTTAPRLIGSKSTANHHKRHKHHHARKASKLRSPARPALPHRRGTFTG
jgi:hypothetical protein